MISPAIALDRATHYIGDALTILTELPDESVDCVVSSPPYFNLRDYGTAQWIGGDPDCDHIKSPRMTKKFGNPEFNKNRPSREDTKVAGYYYDKVCEKCGATKQDSQLGHESTPQEYVAAQMKVFNQLWRTLKPTGTVWWNLDDTYVGAGYSNHTSRFGAAKRKQGGKQKHTVNAALPTKSMMLIPQRLAIALQDAGWCIRREIQWVKGNPVPESVKDRPTKSHEPILFLTKNSGEKRCWYNQQEDYWVWSEPDNVRDRYKEGHRYHKIWRAHDYYYDWRGVTEPSVNGEKALRDTWFVNPRPFPGAHYAVFPLEIPRRCIALGCPKDGVVLDPFMGSGTTAEAALKLGRRVIGIDLNPDNLQFIQDAIARGEPEDNTSESYNQLSIFDVIG